MSLKMMRDFANYLKKSEHSIISTEGLSSNPSRSLTFNNKCLRFVETEKMTLHLPNTQCVPRLLVIKINPVLVVASFYAAQSK